MQPSAQTLSDSAQMQKNVNSSIAGRHDATRSINQSHKAMTIVHALCTNIANKHVMTSQLQVQSASKHKRQLKGRCEHRLQNDCRLFLLRHRTEKGAAPAQELFDCGNNAFVRELGVQEVAEFLRHIFDRLEGVVPGEVVIDHSGVFKLTVRTPHFGPLLLNEVTIPTFVICPSCCDPVGKLVRRKSLLYLTSDLSKCSEP